MGNCIGKSSKLIKLPQECEFDLITSPFGEVSTTNTSLTTGAYASKGKIVCQSGNHDNVKLTILNSGNHFYSYFEPLFSRENLSQNHVYNEIQSRDYYNKGINAINFPGSISKVEIESDHCTKGIKAIDFPKSDNKLVSTIDRSEVVGNFPLEHNPEHDLIIPKGENAEINNSSLAHFDTILTCTDFLSLKGSFQDINSDDFCFHGVPLTEANQIKHNNNCDGCCNDSVCNNCRETCYEDHEETEFKEECNDYYSAVKITVGQPPKHVQEFLNEFSIGRKFAVIHPDVNGGLYVLKSIDTTVWLSHNAISLQNIVPLLFVRSTNPQDFPAGENYSDFLSDVYHFYPHGQRFKQRVVVKIPMKYFENLSFKVLLSETDYGSLPEWKIVDHASKPARDEPFYHYSNGYCYLFLKQFCLFCVVRDTYHIPLMKRVPFLVSMFGLFKPATDVLQITVVFQQNQETPPLPKVYSSLGILLDQDTLCLSNCQQGNLQCKMELNNWNLLVEKSPTVETLLQIEQLPSSPCAKFQFKQDLAAHNVAPCLKVTVLLNNEQLLTLCDASTQLSELILNENLHQNVPEVRNTNVTSTNEPISPPKIREQASAESGQPVPMTIINNPQNSAVKPKIQTVHHSFADQVVTTNNVVMNEVIPYIKETYLKEPDMPSSIKTHFCNMMDQNNWQEFGKQIGHETITESLCQLPGDSPSSVLLGLWQMENKYGWPELVENLEIIGILEAADFLRNWLTSSQSREVFEGESGPSSETKLMSS